MAQIKDPIRRCMPLSEWPALDRQAWEAAIHDGGFFEDVGLAAKWRPDTKRWLITGYGRYLTFLQARGLLDLQLGPAQRITKERLAPYIEELQTQIAPKTLQGRLTALCEAMRIMAPGHSFPYLSLAKCRQKARAHATRDKGLRLVPAEDLFKLGMKLMETAESGCFWRKVGAATTYRDGLIIALLACRPLRRRNFASLEVTKSFTLQGDAYVIDIPGSETKNHSPYRTVLNSGLTSYIQKYLGTYRPFLLGDTPGTTNLWISWGGKPLLDGTLYGVIMARTKAAFGRGLSPHLFRDCAVTSLGNESPEYVWLGMYLLNHKDSRTTEKHYDQALSGTAVRQYQNSLVDQRKKITKKQRGTSMIPRRKHAAP